MKLGINLWQTLINQMTNKIVVYSKNNCVYCTKAKNLLTRLGLVYTERKLEDFESVDALQEAIGKKVRSMPQIVIDDEIVGGYNQLIEYLNNKGVVNYKGEITNDGK